MEITNTGKVVLAGAVALAVYAAWPRKTKARTGKRRSSLRGVRGKKRTKTLRGLRETTVVSSAPFDAINVSPTTRMSIKGRTPAEKRKSINKSISTLRTKLKKDLRKQKLKCELSCKANVVRAENRIDDRLFAMKKTLEYNAGLGRLPSKTKRRKSRR